MSTGQKPAPLPTNQQLAALARQSLHQMLLEGRLSPGDLLKMLSLDSQDKAPARLQDFVVVVQED